MHDWKQQELLSLESREIDEQKKEEMETQAIFQSYVNQLLGDSKIIL